MFSTPNVMQAAYHQTKRGLGDNTGAVEIIPITRQAGISCKPAPAGRSSHRGSGHAAERRSSRRRRSSSRYHSRNWRNTRKDRHSRRVRRARNPGRRRQWLRRQSEIRDAGSRYGSRRRGNY